MFSQEIFIERLQSLMDEQNLTHQAMAEKISVSRSAVTQYLLGIKRPSIDILIAIARYFEVSIDYLVGETENPQRNE